MNSPESPVYRKSRVLYGLNLAKEAIREKGAVIFVEGYMDLLQLYQAGIRNVVATSGTALTEEHARLIRRYTNRVFLCYDADSAGINAAVRGGEILFQQLLETEVLILPAGEDPDSYVKKYGKEAVLEFLTEADDYLAFRLSNVKQKFNLQRAADRSRAAGEMLEMLLPIQDNIRINFYIEKMAEHLQVPSTALLNEFQKKKKAQFQRQRFSELNSSAPESSSRSREQSFSRAPLVFTGAWGGEKDVILLLINYFSQSRVPGTVSFDQISRSKQRQTSTTLRPGKHKQRGHQSPADTGNGRKQPPVCQTSVILARMYQTDQNCPLPCQN
jgi:DNA primase